MRYILYHIFLFFIFSSALFANQPPVVDSTDCNPSNVINPGQQVTITVTAHDPDCSGACTSGCGLYLRSDLTGWAITDPNGNTASITAGLNYGVSGSPYTTSVTWTAPSATGAYIFHLSLSDSGSWLCGGRQTISYDMPLSVAVGKPPVVTSLVADPNIVFTNRVSTIVAQAYDPDGDPLTFAWTADAGIIKTTDTPNKIEWIAPSVGGVYTITVKVQDINGLVATKSTAVSAVVAKFMFSINSGMENPGRIAVDGEGNIYLSDQKLNRVISFTPNGFLRLSLQFNTAPFGIAVDDTGRIYVGDREYREVSIFNQYGKFLRYLESPGGFLFPIDIAVDRKKQRIIVADAGSNSLKIYDYSFNKINEIMLQRFPVGVSVNPDNSEIFVSFGAGGSTDDYVMVYGPDGGLLRSFSPYSTSPAAGKSVRAQGLAVNSKGEAFVADQYEGWVQAFNPSGSHLAYVGSFGGSGGLMRMPSDVAIDKFNRLLVRLNLSYLGTDVKVQSHQVNCGYRQGGN